MPQQDQATKDKLLRQQQLLREREERIVGLETENAMLYLKLAQCQGNVRSTRKETTHIKRLYEDNEKFRNAVSRDIHKFHSEVMDLKLEIQHLKVDVVDIRDKFKDEICKIQDGAIQHLSLMQSLDSKRHMDTEELQQRLIDAEFALDEAQRLANSERTRRRTLHNTLMELRGNIRVHCRVRPMLAELDSGGDPDLLGLPGTPSE